MYSVITEEASLRKNDVINVAITIQAFKTIRFYKLPGFYAQIYDVRVSLKNITLQ